MAIFTFILVFLFTHYVTSALNTALFQVTLTISLVVIFLLGIAGTSYFEVIAIKKISPARRTVLVRRGDLLYIISLMLMTSLPALILFTLSIFSVAVIATFLWALFGIFILDQGRKLRNL